MLVGETRHSTDPAADELHDTNRWLIRFDGLQDILLGQLIHVVHLGEEVSVCLIRGGLLV